MNRHRPTWLVIIAVAVFAAPFAPMVAAAPRGATPAAPETPAAGALELRGALPKPRTFGLAELQRMPADTVAWRYRDADHIVIGVRLDRLLAECGWDRGPMTPQTPAALKRAGLRQAILASAPDGFRSVLSAGELDPIVGPTRAYVVWSMDGVRLAPEFGRLRLAVVTDLEPSRSIHDVRTLEVIDLANGR